MSHKVEGDSDRVTFKEEDSAAWLPGGRGPMGGNGELKWRKRDQELGEE